MSMGIEMYLMERGLIKQERNLYHYTNVDALKKIIDSSTLFATHMQYLNDWSEYERGYQMLVDKLKDIVKNNKGTLAKKEYKILKQKVEELPVKCPQTPQEYRDFVIEKNRTQMEKLLPEVYAVSFCKQPDLLGQWINYAKESGICIEFDFTGFEFICPDVTDKTYMLYGKDVIEQERVYKQCQPMQVVYDEKAVLEVIESDISTYFQKIVEMEQIQIEEQWWKEMGNVFSIVPFFKHSAFSPEEEVRIAVRPISVPLDYIKEQDGKLSGKFEAQIYHIERNHILRPYIKIQWRKENNCGNIIGNSPIKSITVGPGSNQQMTYQSIIHYIEYELNHIPCIERSKIRKIEVAEKIKVTTGNFKDAYVTSKGIIVRKSQIPYIY